MGTWFSYQNWVDQAAATITADAEAGELVATNLANRYASKIWRNDTITGGNEEIYFKVDFGVTREIECLAILFPRSNAPNSYDQQAAFAASDTIRHRLSNVAEDAGELLDTGAQASGVLPRFGYHVFRLPAPVSARFWRCDLNAISRGDTQGYVDVCRAWAGPVLEPAVDVTYGASHGWNSDSPVTSSARGISDYVDPREPRRSFNMTFDWLSEAERDAMEDFDQIMSSAGQFLVVRSDLALARGAMFARQTRSSGLEAVNAHLKSRRAFQLVESL